MTEALAQPARSEPPAAKPSSEGAFEDAALVRQVVQHGSERHFAALIARHQDWVVALAASVLGPRFAQAVDDTAQAAFVKAHQKLATFKGQAAFSTWLYRIVYNTALDARKAAMRHEHRDFEPSRHESAAVGPQQAIDDAQQAARMRQAVDQLPDMYRTIIHLYYWQGCTVFEIAERMQSRVGTIKSYMHRARGRLAALLEDDTEDDI